MLVCVKYNGMFFSFVLIECQKIKYFHCPKKKTKIISMEKYHFHEKGNRKFHFESIMVDGILHAYLYLCCSKHTFNICCENVALYCIFVNVYLIILKERKKSNSLCRRRVVISENSRNIQPITMLHILIQN